MRARRSIHWVLAVGAGVVVVAVALARLAWLTPPPPEPLVIAIADSLLGVPLRVAEQEGFFTAQGLAVTLRLYPTGKLALDALLRGQAEVATVAETPVVFAALAGEPLRVIANYASSGETSLVARADRGIAELADLKGRRVGTSPGTTAHYFLHVLLTDQGLTEADVAVVPVPAPEQAAALAAGRVDAVSTFAPYSTQCRLALGENARTFPAGLRYNGFASLVAVPDFSHRRPEVALRLLRALDRAILWMRGHDPQARALTARTLGLPEAVIAETWGRLRPNLALDQGYVILLQAQARWAIATGLAPAAALPDFPALIDPSALRRLHPESVTVIGTP
ncbi:ABC transporter substrate-binding protein [Candidatus Thiodictyon syntrophicum]|jgi:NitT/TauT family transport system substrate-binding protein|uniref:ABC transporter substrate-binding protein n=1 Tax=Candidatus Thiodictyon syntrophicum TaxID=1166950 RepID=A0A2K8UEV4_9GAMM|nr:NrtA/SsuA/CpmA family ABC transporter substrate-binding protein [Candidatus Thiodictyon syntrophicum]AUB83989.1 ABC transporter substrate-binding protein [Candidatus Thiodictyon syntrophicum]